jgi:GT2 family glycosyltransferase/MoaA/NifB/PqqE/SkfB family radical SAM enzyme
MTTPPKCDPPLTPLRGIACHRPWTGFELFDHLGDVRPCCWGKVTCGNINQSSAEEIWAGPGFEFYREMMIQGNTEAICKSDCPILNGHYTEVIPSEYPWENVEDLFRDVPDSNDSHPKETETAPNIRPSPLYLRVVPSIKCNLSCAFCYQLDDPPATLPKDLFEQLEPWLKGAFEFQILGGEPFIAKECLSWIEQLTPSRFPNLGLAAITNGLGFTPQVCDLISQRKWHWILVSMDAATRDVYKEVRGGEFEYLMEGLDKLAELRALATEPFEIRLGFTIQNKNLRDTFKFLDICREYSAVPQFTTVFGDWHDGLPATREQRLAIIGTVESLDKELQRRGYPTCALAGAIKRLERSLDSPLLKSSTIPRLIYADPSPSGLVQLRRGLQKAANNKQSAIVEFAAPDPTGLQMDVIGNIAGAQWVVPCKDCGSSAGTTLIQDIMRDGVGEITLEIPPNSTENQVLKECNRLELLARSSSVDVPLCIIVGPGLRSHLNLVLNSLDVNLFSDVTLQIPYIVLGKSISALEYCDLVEEVKMFLHTRGKENIYGRPKVRDLGLDIERQYPNSQIIYQSRKNKEISISVVSAVHNSAAYLETFLSSISEQNGFSSAEIILVDDGSTDESVATAYRSLEAMRSMFDVCLISLERKRPYVHGTFSFGAGTAREVGVKHSMGRRVLFLDPDQAIEPDCLRIHEWAFGGIADVVIGDRKELGARESIEWKSLRRRSIANRHDWWLSFYTGNSSVSREVFELAGGFDETLQYWGLDDTDLGYRLCRAGATAIHTTRAVVNHLASASSGGGATSPERNKAFRLHMEVMYRKYLDKSILLAFNFLWDSDITGGCKKVCVNGHSSVE